jgi:hypothetical protein
MLFFRSEEHRRRWAQFDPQTKEGAIGLPDLIRLFSGNYFKRRLDPDYMSHLRDYGKEFISDLRQIQSAGAFWKI